MCGRSNIGKGQYVVIYSECISSKYFSTKGGGVVMEDFVENLNERLQRFL